MITEIFGHLNLRGHFDEFEGIVLMTRDGFPEHGSCFAVLYGNLQHPFGTQNSSEARDKSFLLQVAHHRNKPISFSPEQVRRRDAHVLVGHGMGRRALEVHHDPLLDAPGDRVDHLGDQGIDVKLELSLRFVRYSLATWVAIFAAPWLLLKLKLADSN